MCQLKECERSPSPGEGNFHDVTGEKFSSLSARIGFDHLEQLMAIRAPSMNAVLVAR
jgi:hypothetical protein